MEKIIIIYGFFVIFLIVEACIRQAQLQEEVIKNTNPYKGRCMGLFELGVIIIDFRTYNTG